MASNKKQILLFLIPLSLLAGVIVLFLATGGAGLRVDPVVPQEFLSFEKTVLLPGAVELQVRNLSAQKLSIAQINLDDGFVHFTLSPSGAIPRLGEAKITIPYPWVEGEAYSLTLFSANSVPFSTVIDAATLTRTAVPETLGSFTLIGLYVGVLPVFLGIFWLPALRKLGQGSFLWLLALTVGLLLFLGIDAFSEALENAAFLGGAFQGPGLVGMGLVGTFLLLEAVSRKQKTQEADEGQRRLKISLMISVGIGLHNLGEGLAIGAAFAVGAAALGTFLVVGFILQNITEGLGIIAPILRQQPKPLYLFRLGLIAGLPAVAGTWMGGLLNSTPLSVLFLSVGAGAVFQVAWEIGRLIRDQEKSTPHPLTVYTGVLAGMLVMYLTGFLIK